MEENLVLRVSSETIGSAGKGSFWNDGIMESWNDGFKARKHLASDSSPGSWMFIPQYSSIPTFHCSGLSAP
jgi:hypothetical protein